MSGKHRHLSSVAATIGSSKSIPPHATQVVSHTPTPCHTRSSRLRHPIQQLSKADIDIRAFIQVLSQPKLSQPTLTTPPSAPSFVRVSTLALLDEQDEGRRAPVQEHHHRLIRYAHDGHLILREMARCQGQCWTYVIRFTALA
ncbi:hypothetical protein N7532_009719 [Penicillium argentinense]|uniref:Uncharacterized protein n=1 Tax=Penicillium argentinense TaxID=1131581 RepID=A0A9W9K352_9EURO|nr:uncharacterized protein N7532_009719 [Penicillium argentinense]KAJ5091035.1 hypothetical protein N7532_009719 [Penicillium argentinense]